MNYETEHYHDQEITFTYEGQDYLWIGDYTIEHTGTIEYTRSLSSYEHGYEVIPTRSMLMELEIEIERNY